VGIVPDRTSQMFERGGRRLYPDEAEHPAARHLQLYKDWERWAAEGSVDGICAEDGCQPVLKLQGADIGPLRKTLAADFPVYTWADTMCYTQRGGGPFSLVNWDRHPVEGVLEQIELARRSGAAGIVLHGLYQFTAADTAGESIGGYGVLPRTEYFDALRRRAANREQTHAR